MAIQVEISGIQKTLPELLIGILSKEYPLRIKELHGTLKRGFFLEISFQAVRKALNLMVSQGKLELHKNEYQISKEWIKESKKLSDKLIANYFRGELKEKPPKIRTIGKQLQIYHFSNALQTDKFLGELLLDIASTPGEKVLTIQALHYWYFLGHLGTESNFILEMKKRKIKLYYVSFGNNTLLDKLSKQFYEQHGMKFKIIKDNLERYSEVVAIHDIIIQIQYDKEFIEKLDKTFKQTKKIQDLDFKQFGKLIKSDYPVTLTILRDKTMASSIIKNTLSQF